MKKLICLLVCLLLCGCSAAPAATTATTAALPTEAVQEGFGGYVLFVIQMADVAYLHPNDATDPNFGKALREAKAAGVEVMAVDCDITVDSMVIRKAVPVIL